MELIFNRFGVTLLKENANDVVKTPILQEFVRPLLFQQWVLVVDLLRLHFWQYKLIMHRWRILEFNEENSVGQVGTILHQRFDDLVRVLLLINTAIIEKLLPE